MDDSYGDHLQHVRDSAREELHSGFVTRDELVEGMRELRLAGGPDEPLHLGFDAVEPDGGDPASREEYDRARVLVGRTVVAALTERGLRSTWDGSAGHRIAVRVPDWRRPLPGS